MKKCRGSRLLSLGHIPGGLDIIVVNILNAPRSVKQHLVSSQPYGREMDNGQV